MKQFLKFFFEYGIGTVSLLFIVIALKMPLYSLPQNSGGTEEFSFLSLSLNTVPSGLAGAYTAKESGIDGIHLNPAGLAYLKGDKALFAEIQKNVSTSHTGSFAYTYRTPSSLVTAYKLQYSIIEEQTLYDMSKTNIGHTRPFNLNLSVNTSKILNKYITVGGGLILPFEYLGDFSGSTVAMGWGFEGGIHINPKSRSWDLGASIINAGVKQSGHFEGDDAGGLLPLEFKTGFVYHLPSLWRADFIGDFSMPYHQKPYVNGGIETPVNPFFIVRAGARLSIEEIQYYFNNMILTEDGTRPAQRNDLKLAAGFTISKGQYGLDYAAQWWELQGIVHRLRLVYGY